MKTAVELAWLTIGFTAFCLSIYALNDLNVNRTFLAYCSVAIFGLIWATWHTHWKH